MQDSWSGYRMYIFCRSIFISTLLVYSNVQEGNIIFKPITTYSHLILGS